MVSHEGCDETRLVEVVVDKVVLLLVVVDDAEAEWLADAADELEPGDFVNLACFECLAVPHSLPLLLSMAS